MSCGIIHSRIHIRHLSAAFDGGSLDGASNFRINPIHRFPKSHVVLAPQPRGGGEGVHYG